MASRTGNKRALASRPLVRAGLVVTAGGAASAQAAPVGELVDHTLSNARNVTADAEAEQKKLPSPQEAMARTTPAVVGGVLGPVKRLQLDPFAGTGADPLANAIGTQVADFLAVSTADVTAPLTRGDTIAELPLVRDALGMLPG